MTIKKQSNETSQTPTERMDTVTLTLEEWKSWRRAAGLLEEWKSWRRAAGLHKRSAQPCLICRVEPQGNRSFKVTPYIAQSERGCDEILSEGYDPDHSPLGCPVYWRVVKRGDQQFYWSTFVATRDQVIRTWGPGALVYCEATNGTAVARIETKLPGSAL